MAKVCKYCSVTTCSGCPSPSQIAERAAEVRAGWSERERQQRAGINPDVPSWLPPLVHSQYDPPAE